MVAFILSVLILSLNCFPCNDQNDVCCEQKSHSSEKQTPCGDTSESEESCSPFCQCSCCSAFSMVSASLNIENTGIEIAQNRVYTDYFQISTLEIALPIWQPPQLI